MNEMRRFRWLVPTLAMAAFATTANAHEGHHHDAMGTVKAIDAAKLDLETKDGALESFMLTEKTAYKRGNAAAAHHDVAVGDRAVVMYEKKDGKNVAVEVKLGAKKKGSAHEGHPGSEAEPSPPPAAASTASLADPPAAIAPREVEPRFVCMVNNTVFDKPQIPVEVEGKTYFGCCMLCKERLARDAQARTAVDPVTGGTVDKATAVPAVLPDGRVLYFESRETLARWTGAGRS